LKILLVFLDREFSSKNLLQAIQEVRILFPAWEKALCSNYATSSDNVDCQLWSTILAIFFRLNSAVTNVTLHASAYQATWLKQKLRVTPPLIVFPAEERSNHMMIRARNLDSKDHQRSHTTRQDHARNKKLMLDALSLSYALLCNAATRVP